jgi:murein DD-endopeptidase MepM/ murein hydrolase activator NlpD
MFREDTRQKEAFIHVLEDSLQNMKQRLELLRPAQALLLEKHRDIERSLAESLNMKRRLSDWTLLSFLLGFDSWKDLLNRRAALNRISEAHSSKLSDVKNEYKAITELEALIAATHTGLNVTQSELAKSLEEKRRAEDLVGLEIRQLEISRKNLKSKLNGIQKNNELLRLQRRETEQASQSLATYLIRIEKGEPATGFPVSLLKGRLPWPAKGKVVQEFGVVRSREHATYTDNPGIDIEVSVDADVRAVADGIVNSISWLRGFGNVCIVEHSESFYTVYAHLESVNVESGQTINQGSIVGSPGLDAGTGEYRIHFELWSGKEKKNPLEWLTKTPS